MMERSPLPFHAHGHDSVRIVDVSHHNDVPLLNNMYDSRLIDGVIIRASFGANSRDKKTAEWVEWCKQKKLPFGFYHYSYATEVMEVHEEVQNFALVVREYLNNDLFRLGVYMDWEDADGYKLKNGLNVYSSKAFEIINEWLKQLDVIYNFAGLYMSKYLWEEFDDTFNEAYNHDDIYKGKIFKWIAQWGIHKSLVDKESNEIPEKEYFLWQYSNSPCDVNVMDLECFKKIKRKGQYFYED
ncbi:MAG: hypothetical protein K2G70_07630 [Turicibacter sp.]|nr:hypothetical protein [Turicibacter sp.]